MVSANAAAFASSNATAIAIAKVSAEQSVPQGVNCLSYSQAYADAVASVITTSPVQVSAAASAVAAAFAQGCTVERATGLALTELIHTLGCETVGPVLLSKSADARLCKCTCLHGHQLSLQLLHVMTMQAIAAHYCERCLHLSGHSTLR